MSESVTLIAAAEFGSGANGLASANSDYDVVFVYVRRLPCYFCVDPTVPHDTRENLRFEHLRLSERVVVDAQGFDARQAIKMIKEGNLTILDMLASPSPVYGTAEDRRVSAPSDYFFKTAGSLLQRQRWQMNKSLAWQLWGKATRHDKLFFNCRWAKRQLLGETSPCITKKYFYVIVPLLRLLWLSLRIQQHPDDSFCFPPLEFDALIPADIPHPHAVAALANLVHRKRMGELTDELEPLILDLDVWLSELFSTLQHFLHVWPVGESIPDLQLHSIWDRFWFELAMVTSDIQFSFS